MKLPIITHRSSHSFKLFRNNRCPHVNNHHFNNRGRALAGLKFTTIRLIESFFIISRGSMYESRALIFIRSNNTKLRARPTNCEWSRAQIILFKVIRVYALVSRSKKQWAKRKKSSLRLRQFMARNVNSRCWRVLFFQWRKTTVYWKKQKLCFFQKESSFCLLLDLEKL